MSAKTQPELNIVEVQFSTVKPFTPPTIEEAVAYGKEIALPETECRKFWFYYDAKDWFVGKSKMKKWKSALSGWHLRWRETQPQAVVQKPAGDKFLNRWTVGNPPIRPQFQNEESFRSHLRAFEKWRDARPRP